MKFVIIIILYGYSFVFAQTISDNLAPQTARPKPPQKSLERILRDFHKSRERRQNPYRFPASEDFEKERNHELFDQLLNLILRNNKFESYFNYLFKGQ